MSELMLWWTPPAPKPINRLFRLNHIPASKAGAGEQPERERQPSGDHAEYEQGTEDSRGARHDRYHHAGVRLERIASGEASDHLLKAFSSGDAAQKVTSTHIYEYGTCIEADPGQPAADSREIAHTPKHHRLSSTGQSASRLPDFTDVRRTRRGNCDLAYGRPRLIDSILASEVFGQST